MLFVWRCKNASSFSPSIQYRCVDRRKAVVRTSESKGELCGVPGATTVGRARPQFATISPMTDSLVFWGRLQELEVFHRWSRRSTPVVDETGRQRVVPALSLVVNKKAIILQEVLRSLQERQPGRGCVSVVYCCSFDICTRQALGWQEAGSPSNNK